MYVISDADTGYLDESMRFATKREALEYINNHSDRQYIIRYEV